MLAAGMQPATKSYVQLLSRHKTRHKAGRTCPGSIDIRAANPERSTSANTTQKKASNQEAAGYHVAGGCTPNAPTQNGSASANTKPKKAVYAGTSRHLQQGQQGGGSIRGIRGSSKMVEALVLGVWGRAWQRHEPAPHPSTDCSRRPTEAVQEPPAHWCPTIGSATTLRCSRAPASCWTSMATAAAGGVRYGRAEQAQGLQAAVTSGGGFGGGCWAAAERAQRFQNNT